MIFTTMEQDPPLTMYELLGEEQHDISSTTKSQLSSSSLDVVAKLHELPVFVSSTPEELFHDALVDIFFIWLSIVVTHVVLLQLFKRHRRIISEQAKKDEKAISKDDDWNKVKLENWSGSYQMTNMIINFVLGIFGIYRFLLLPPISNTTMNERIVWNDNTIFAKAQLAYQFWALPVGVFMVNESTAMVLHHVSVIAVGSMTSFFTAGFRYHSPFFYGLIEISSVPLSVMNMFKNHREWIDRRPKVYRGVKLLFAIVFLITRVILWIPQMADFLYLITCFCRTCENYYCVSVTSVMIGSSVFLTLLQLYWANKIVRGLLTQFLGIEIGGAKRSKKVLPNPSFSFKEE